MHATVHTDRSWRCTLMNLGVKGLPSMQARNINLSRVNTMTLKTKKSTSAILQAMQAAPEAARAAAVARPPGAKAGSAAGDSQSVRVTVSRGARFLLRLVTFEIGVLPSHFGISASADRPWQPRQPPCWRCEPCHMWAHTCACLGGLWAQLPPAASLPVQAATVTVARRRRGRYSK